MWSEQPRQFNQALTAQTRGAASIFAALKKILVALLIATALFDPMDLVGGFKVYFFSVFIMVGTMSLLFGEKGCTPSIDQLIFVLAFSILLPVWGLLVAEISNAYTYGNDGLQYFKSYLFLLYSLLLYPLCVMEFAEKCFLRLLMVLCHGIILLYALTLFLDPGTVGMLVDIGTTYYIVFLGSRNYGGVEFPTIYWTTAPLLAFVLSYWCEKASEKATPIVSYCLVIAWASLFLAGTRNTILISFLIPGWYLLHSRKGRGLLIAFAFVVGYIYFDVFASMFDPVDESISTKLGYLSEYMEIFGDVRNLLLGQGLGARFFASSVGPVGQYVSITELTLLEIVRVYGIILGSVVVIALLYPIALLRGCGRRYMVVGYLFYLLGALTNPLMFSSTGMLVMGLVVAAGFNPLAQPPKPLAPMLRPT